MESRPHFGKVLSTYPKGTTLLELGVFGTFEQKLRSREFP